MLLSKPITTALLAAFASVSAFTTPNAALGVRHGLSTTDLRRTPQYQPRHSRDFDQQSSLKLWKQDSSAAAIDTYVESTLEKVEEEVPTSVLALVGSALLGFTFVVQKLQIYLNTPCLNAGKGSASSVCTSEYYDFSQFFLDHNILSFMMILTHSIPFVLLPWVSKQVSEVGPIIKKDFEGFNPFLSKYYYH